jgi:hypothetical protein
MSVHSGTAGSVATPSRQAESSSAVYAEGITAGLVGAATIALWFLIVDTFGGRPFYTPAVLGTALLQGTDALAAPERVPVQLETVLTFTWLHVLAFLLIGVAASKLLEVAEHNTNLGFGIVLLFVFFEAGFFVMCMAFAQPLLRALTWPAVVVGNLLAAVAMAWTFWRRHPRLVIQP